MTIANGKRQTESDSDSEPENTFLHLKSIYLYGSKDMRNEMVSVGGKVALITHRKSANFIVFINA